MFRSPLHYITIVLAGIILFNIGCQQTGSKGWHTDDNYRWKQMGSPFHFFDQTGFEKKSPDNTDISFRNTLTEEQISKNRNLLNGSGVAAGDIDDDGLVDLYFARLNGPNKLYKNLGDWEFKDITQKANVELEDQFSTGVHFADIDGDGDLDLLVTALGSTNKLFINNGRGQFKEKTKALGTEIHGSMSGTFADIDRDGDLDLYITNYKHKSAKDLYPNQRNFSDIVKKDNQGNYYIPNHLQPHYEYERRGDVILWFEKGENDLLYKNDGAGNFTKVPLDNGSFQDQAGNSITNHKGWGLHARFFDINEDGYPDLYVCNDFETPDRIWMNNGDGTFTEIDSTAIRHLSLSSMAVDMADINRDGKSDIFVVEMLSRDYRLRSKQLSTMVPLADTTGKINNRPLYMGNTLFLNREDNTFAEIANYSGVTASEWSWATLFLDIDLDGYEDILVATGNYFDTQDLDANSKIARREQMGIINPREVMFEYPSLESQNIAFRNKGDLKFEDISAEWGFDAKDISHGMATADLDNDGDQDLVFNRMDSVAGIYENKSTNSRVRIKLHGDSANTEAIGSSIEVSLGSLKQEKRIFGSGTYLSSSARDYTFAANHDSSMSIRITWPDQTITTIPDVKPNRYYEIFKKEDKAYSSTDYSNKQDTTTAFFKDISSQLNHQHIDQFFEDFEKHPLLPYRLSQYGPGVSFFDATGNGADDLFIGSGRGGELAYYENDGKGNFTKISNKDLSFQIKNDLSGIVGWKDSSSAHLAVGNYFYENRDADSNPFFMFTKKQANTFIQDSLATDQKTGLSATGPLAVADIDSDGDLDLFVGKRLSPLQYPRAISSTLYINKNDKLHPDKKQPEIFKNIGMVSGAVFSDLDQDGYPELLLAMDWGPIRIFDNNKGSFTEITESTVFRDLKGTWNGITTGDFNNDGRLDIVATNKGLNHFYSASPESKQYLYYGDITNDGITDILEAHYEKDLEAIVPDRKLRVLGSAIPSLGKRFWSHEKFSQSTLSEIAGFASPELDTLETNFSKTMVFLNQDNGFKPVSLPKEAQFSPAFSAVVADYNGDGNEDIFLSQNFFATRIQDRRIDAGRGLWLRGDGEGIFSAVSGSESGIKVNGEQRSAAVSDIDRDGRIDLLVTQNGNQTKLFSNRKAKPGLTVTLEGPKNNPDAIGASIRFKYENFDAPRKEIKAGSGYWSQNTTDILVGYPEYPTAIEVNWPGGQSNVFNITKKTNHLTLHYDGQINYH